MPSIAFPVPVYTTLTSSPAPLTTQKRALSTTSPGTTDDTATGINGGVVGVHAMFRPGSTITGTTGSGTTAPSPPTIDDGWLLPISPTLVASGDGLLLAAANWTVPYHYSRPGGILTADVPHTVTAILARLDSTGTVFKSEVGRSAAQALTATTTEQSFNFTVTGVATEFDPGDILMKMLYFDRAGALSSDTVRCHTNSTTALRITAAPNYAKIHYTQGSSDGAATADGKVNMTNGTVGTSAGTAAADGQLVSVIGTVGTSAGTAAADGQLAKVQPTVGSAAGVAAADGKVAQAQAVVGTAAGVATADGQLAGVQAVVGSSAGVATADGKGGVVIGTVGTAAGAATADGKTAKVIGTVGTATVGGGGGDTLVYPVFQVNA